MPDWMLPLAQAGGPDTLAGTSGWVGAGLLGLILFWLLFKHLPAKDKQIEDLVNKHDDRLTAALERQAKDHREAAERRELMFFEALERIEKRHEQQTAAVVAAVERVSDRLERVEDAVTRSQAAGDQPKRGGRA